MRDIRGDLQDRASFLEEQINAAQAQFDQLIGQLKQEHEARLAELTDELEAVTTLIEVEHRRLTSAAPAQEAEPRRRQAPPPEAEPRRHASAPPVHEAEHHRRAPEAEPYRRPAPEHERQPVMQEAEAPRRHQAEAEPYRRPAPPPEPEHYRRPVAQDAEPPRRPQAEAEPHRRPVAQEAEYQRRPAPTQTAMHAPEPEEDRRPAAPQVYRRPPMASAQEQEQRRPAPSAPQPQGQAPLADFLIRKLNEIGAMTLDDLCHLAVQEGYFARGEIADRGVHVTLMNVVKAGFIRQLPNGTFAPATVMDTIRLRRAI